MSYVTENCLKMCISVVSNDAIKIITFLMLSISRFWKWTNQLHPHSISFGIPEVSHYYSVPLGGRLQLPAGRAKYGIRTKICFAHCVEKCLERVEKSYLTMLFFSLCG